MVNLVLVFSSLNRMSWWISVKNLLAVSIPWGFVPLTLLSAPLVASYFSKQVEGRSLNVADTVQCIR